jgi:hypothetical protein
MIFKIQSLTHTKYSVSVKKRNSFMMCIEITYDQVKENEMGKACNMSGGEEECI